MPARGTARDEVPYRTAIHASRRVRPTPYDEAKPAGIVSPAATQRTDNTAWGQVLLSIGEALEFW